MKKILVFLVGAAGLLASAVFYSYLHFRPQYSGELNIPGLQSAVEVHFDTFGIPHIEAQNRADLYRAYGYLVAQDRLFQMQMQKRIASGRLSEWFGSVTLETDKTLRTIGFHRWAQAWLQRQQNKINPALLSDAQSWLDGVNACVELCPRPLEMVLLGVQPEKIEMVDIFAFSGTMAFSFTKAFFQDAVLTDVAAKLDGKMLEDLVGEKILNKSSLVASLRLPLLKDLDPMGFLPNMDGSQSWVVAPQKSASGKATLANDPHIAFSHPGVWYEAHLKAPGFELYGHFIPIIPFALIGHNADKAWALTMSNADELDLVLQKEVESYSLVKEMIKVKDQSDVEFPLRVTVWGPVIEQVVKADRNFIMHWGFYSEDNFVVESFYDLNHATQLSQFLPALEKGHAPGLNISWADKEGNIAWSVFGRFPQRRGPAWQAQELSPGQAVYEGYWPKTMNPQSVNPKSGFIVSANQKPPVAFDDKKLSGYWDSSERYETLVKRFQKMDKVSIEDQQKLFMVNELEGARERLQALLEEVDVDDEDLFKQLQDWNGEASLHNTVLGFYFEWMDAIGREVLLAKLSEKQLEQFCDTNAYWIFLNRIVNSPNSLWWQGRRGEFLQKTFDYTVRYMRNTYGHPQKWTWDRMHTWTLESPLGKVKPLDKIFNLGPYPVNGSYMVPNALRHKFCRGSFAVTAGPSTRRLVDFANPRESWGILPSGNSGVVFSPHYKDQIQLYMAGELRPQLMDWKLIRLQREKLSLPAAGK